MNIVIWGDSWGQPNWAKPQSGFTAEGHTANRLRRLGYEVENLSENGHGNITSIQRQSHIKPDWVIWFHTELTRDFPIFKKELKGTTWTYLDMCNSTAEFIYSLASDKLVSLNNPKLIVIEGQAPLWPGYEKYITPYKTIPWKEQLLNTSLPHTHLTGQWNILKDVNNRDTTSIKLDLIKDAQNILKLMWHSNYFTDNCHPNDLAHLSLTTELDELFRGSL